MKTPFLILCGAAVMLAAPLPTKNIRGTYVEARSADVFVGPCFANSEVELKGDLALGCLYLFDRPIPRQFHYPKDIALWRTKFTRNSLRTA